ncbi:MFS transporter [Streptomyces sp. NPDC057249]|uniref:MFS transporter n=1 Tax=Streptomyces sp. NPDC057249 TaxID=3346067 RepID=UPI0036288DC5
MTDTTSAPTAPSLFRNRDFLLLWIGQMISQLGNAVTNFALPVLVLGITGSPARTGLVLAAQQIPYLLLGLHAGVLVDRWDRRRTMIVADAVRFAVLGAVAVTAYTGDLELRHLLVAAVVTGAAFTFFDIADNSSFPRVVGAGQLPRAASLSEGGGTAAQLLGPLVAGLLLGLGGTRLEGSAFTYGLDAMTFLAGIALLLGIRRPLQEPRDATAAVEPVRKALATGVTFLVRHRELRLLAGLNFVVCGLLAPIQLILLTRGAVDDVATERLSLVFTLGGIGGIAGAALTPVLRDRLDHRKVMVLATAVWGAGTALAAAGSGLLPLVGSWTLFSLMVPVYFSTMYAHRVTLIPDRVLGRVNSIYRLLSQASPPAGVALGGALIGWAGAEPVALALSAAFLLTAALTWTALAPAAGPPDPNDAPEHPNDAPEHPAGPTTPLDGDTPRHSMDMAHFDRAYAKAHDPWSTLTSAYEREKIALALAALPRERYGEALDLGCGVGALTEELARIARSVVAADGSEGAVAQATERLAHLGHATVRHLLLPPRSALGGTYDLVAMSEVGYYLTPGDLHTTVRAVVDAMKPGADLLLVHWSHDHPDHRVTGAEVHEAFAAHPALEPLSRGRHTLHGNSFQIDVLRLTRHGAGPR